MGQSCTFQAEKHPRIRTGCRDYAHRVSPAMAQPEGHQALPGGERGPSGLYEEGALGRGLLREPKPPISCWRANEIERPVGIAPWPVRRFPFFQRFRCARQSRSRRDEREPWNELSLLKAAAWSKMRISSWAASRNLLT